MERKIRKRAVAISAAAGLLLASAGIASAQTIGDEAKCRATIAKNVAKLNATAGKTLGGCIKNVTKGKQTLAPGEKCHQTATADTKGKVDKADTKLQDAVGGAKDKCPNGASEHAITLAGFGTECAVGVGGAGFPIADFDDVSDCLAAAAIGNAELLQAEVLNPDYGAIALQGDGGKLLGGCAATIAKGVGKAAATIVKGRTKAQSKIEKSSVAVVASYDEFKNPGDAKTNGKIDKAIAKIGAGIDKKCAGIGTAELIILGACDTSSVANYKTCIGSAVRNHAEGLAGLAYLNPDKRPVGAVVMANSGTSSTGGSTAQGGTPNGTRNRTVLSAGWTGLGHNVDILDGFIGQVDLDCSTGGVCVVSESCVQGNCRCDNDETMLCDEPGGPDADDCGGADCNNYFGPPLALSASGTPTCVVNIIDSVLGSVDLGNGSTSTSVANRALIFTSSTNAGTQSKPCPTCEAGSCSGGARDTLACTVNGIHPTFGPTSYDCQPDGAQVAGTGAQIALEISDEPADLVAVKSCDRFPADPLKCQCRACTLDGTVPCNTDADCAAVLAGVCESNGTGTQTNPNGCNDAECDVDPATGADICGDGPDAMYCDGLIRARGGQNGVITCADNTDCDTLDAECPGGDCGDCTLVQPRPCFPNDAASGDSTINASELTNSGAEHAVLGTTFCIPPTTSGAVNGAGGIPGPGKVLIDFNFDILCDDGITEAEYGGFNCP